MTQENNNPPINNSNSEINFSDIWAIFLGNYKTFIFTTLIALAISIAYIIITPPTFKRQTSILIKDESEGKGIKTQQAQNFEDLGLFKSNTNIKNEIEVLKTPFLMQETVNRLKLNYNYATMYKNVRRVDLYHNTPFTVTLDTLLDNSSIDFQIEIQSANSFTISDVHVNKNDAANKLKGQFSKPMETVYGKITIEPTKKFNKHTIGETFYFSKNTIKAAAKNYLSRLEVSLLNKEASVVNIGITDGVPQRAEDLLNTLVLVYNENWIKDKNLVTRSTSQFINDRLFIIENELGIVDGDIAQFKSTNLLPDVAAVANLSLSRSSANTNQQLMLNNQIAMARYLKQYLNDASTKNQLLPANIGIDNTAIENQIEKYNTLLLQKNNLAANSGEKNPVVANMINTLSATKEAINKSVEDLIHTLNLQLNNTLKDEKWNKTKIASNPTQAQHLLSAERQQKVKEALYLFLLQKREENELSQAFTAYNTKVLNVATGDIYPVTPKKSLILIIAFLLGIILPLLYLFLKENLDTLVRKKSDLNMLNIPLLGVIPQLTKEKKYLRRKLLKDTEQPLLIVIEDNNRNSTNEAFRIIRTNLDFMNNEDAINKVFQFSSFDPNSGKSFIAINLAISMAIKDTKILLIDADMRKASLSKAIESPHEGLSTYLSGQTDTIEKGIIKGKFHTKLDIIPVGKLPPNPSELLLSKRFTTLIDSLKANYDYIFIDCPPIGVVSDATIVSKHCDMTLFILRAGLFDKRMLPDLEDLHQSKRLKNMSLILNGVDYRYHKYGYYGNYGYNNTDVEG